MTTALAAGPNAEFIEGECYVSLDLRVRDFRVTGGLFSVELPGEDGRSKGHLVFPADLPDPG